MGKSKNPEARSYRGFLFERVPANLAGDCTGSNYGLVIANAGYICNGYINSHFDLHESSAMRIPSLTLPLPILSAFSRLAASR